MNSRRKVGGCALLAIALCVVPRLLAQAQQPAVHDAVARHLREVRSADRAIAQRALAALHKVGPDAKGASPALLEEVHSEHRLVREVARQLLRRIDPQRASEVLGKSFDPVSAKSEETQDLRVGRGDWPQLGGSRSRNNTPEGRNVPTLWQPGDFDRRTGAWIAANARNIKWVSRLGSQSYGNMVVANGKIFVGTNNGAGYLQRYPDVVDLGCLLCFRESDGQFLWQHSSEKLPTGRVHDWPLQGICSSPIVQGDRLWFVTSRGEVVCLDTEGFYDEQDDGPVTDVWSRLFEVVARLKPAEAFAKSWLFNEYHQTLAPVFKQASAAELYSQSIEPGGGPNQWFLNTGGQTPTRLARVRLENSTLRITGVGNNRGKELVIGLDLLAGLDEGRLSPALQAHLQAKGVAVSDTVRLTLLARGSSWAITSSSGGGPVQLRLDLEGSKLVCDQKISPLLKSEADVVWSVDMMKDLGVSQHNMATCAPTMWGDVLFICTSNGVDESHTTIPAPHAPSFMAMDKHSGKVLWTDNSPGDNILHGQWSCPVVGVFEGVPQVIFAGGDGWLYSFRADRWSDGKPELLWKFDGNPKDSIYILGGRGTRNEIISVPVVYDGLIYLAMGQDPEHGEGVGDLWCIDPTRRGDVSGELVVDAAGRTLPHGRLRATTPSKPLFQTTEYTAAELDQGKLGPEILEEFRKAGSQLPDPYSMTTVERGRKWRLEVAIDNEAKQLELRTSHVLVQGKWIPSLTVVHKAKVIPNPNSAVVWHYDHFDLDGNGAIEFEETMHRTIGSPTIKNDVLFIADFSGLLHCVNAKTGIPHWTCDLLAACWTTPLIVEDKVYVADEDGDIAMFGLSADPSGFVKRNPDHVGPAHEINMGNSVYMMPIVANNVLYIATKTHLYAIRQQSD